MEPFTTLTGIAAPLERPNVDTDQIAPARFLRRPRKDGYGDILFHDLRFSAPNQEFPDFILNQPAFRKASILVADRNFGGGSSREQAVWSLVDYGIRCVIAQSFGDIFWENSVKGGLLLIRQDEPALVRWRDKLRAAPGTTITVDLEAQTISQPGGAIVPFEVEVARKRRLLLGLDDIGITLRHQDTIMAAETAYRARRPWLFNRPVPS